MTKRALAGVDSAALFDYSASSAHAWASVPLGS